MTNDLHEALERFNSLPDDAILPSRITGIILGISERNDSLSPVSAARANLARSLRSESGRHTQARA